MECVAHATLTTLAACLRVYSSIGIGSVSADMKKILSAIYRIGRFEKWDLSVLIGIGRYEKKLIGRTLLYYNLFDTYYACFKNGDMMMPLYYLCNLNAFPFDVSCLETL